MAEHAKTKWAIDPLPVTSLDDIDITDEALLERAACDFCMEFVNHIVRGKTTSGAIAALDCWRNWLETVRRNHDPV